MAADKVTRFLASLLADKEQASAILNYEISYYRSTADNLQRLRSDTSNQLIQHVNHHLEITPSAVEKTIRDLRALANALAVAHQLKSFTPKLTSISGSHRKEQRCTLK